jgi:hypothetical protein
MSALLNSSLPPSAYLNKARARASSAADAFAGSDVLMPPRPDDGVIPDWHLATAMKPLRPLPRDLADTVRHRSARPAVARSSAARAQQAQRPAAATARLPAMPTRASRRWVLRVVGLLLATLLAGAVIGSLFEHVVLQGIGGVARYAAGSASAGRGA